MLVVLIQLKKKLELLNICSNAPHHQLQNNHSCGSHLFGVGIGTRRWSFCNQGFKSSAGCCALCRLVQARTSARNSERFVGARREGCTETPVARPLLLVPPAEEWTHELETELVNAVRQLACSTGPPSLKSTSGKRNTKTLLLCLASLH